MKRKQRIAKLVAESEEIKEKFDQFAKTVLECILKRRTISLVEAVNSTDVYERTKDKTNHRMSGIIHIEKFDPIEKQFGLLKSHASFFNYKLLTAVALKLCQDDSVVMKCMHDYLVQFKVFCKRSVAEVPPSVYCESMPRDHSHMIVATAFTNRPTNMCLEEANLIKENIAHKIGLNPCTLSLQRVEGNKRITMVINIPKVLATASSLSFYFPKSRFNVGCFSVKALLCEVLERDYDHRGGKD